MAARHEGASASAAKIGGGFAPPVPQLAAPAVSLPPAGGAIRGIGEKFAANPAHRNGGRCRCRSPPARAGRASARSCRWLRLRNRQRAIRLRLVAGAAGGDPPDRQGPAALRRLRRVPALRRRGPGGRARAPTAATAGSRSARSDPPHAPGYRIDRYRPRTEGLFARIERWTGLSDGDTHWRSVTRDNVTQLVRPGRRTRGWPTRPTRRGCSAGCCAAARTAGATRSATSTSRRTSDGVDLGAGARAPPELRSSARPTATSSGSGTATGSRASSIPTRPDPGWMFEVVFDYGEHDAGRAHPGRRRSRCRAAPTRSPPTAPASRCAPTGCAGGC